MPSNTIELLPNETFEKVMAVNFMSFVYLAKCAIPHLRASKGSYGVTSSMAGKYFFVSSTSWQFLMQDRINQSRTLRQL